MSEQVLVDTQNKASNECVGGEKRKLGCQGPVVGGQRVREMMKDLGPCQPLPVSRNRIFWKCLLLPAAAERTTGFLLRDSNKE